MANFGFSVSETEYSERGDFEPMPKGEYTLKGTDAEMKDTSAGTGKYLACEFEVLKPAQYAGRKVWQNFNIFNPNEKAEKIGREQVAGWAKACGRPNAKDSDELLERSFDCKLDIEKGTGGYSDKNKIAAFLMPGSAGKSAGTPAPAAKSKFDDEPSPAKKEELAEEAPAKQEETASAPKTEAQTGKKKNPWD